MIRSWWFRFLIWFFGQFLNTELHKGRRVDHQEREPEPGTTRAECVRDVINRINFGLRNSFKRWIVTHSEFDGDNRINCGFLNTKKWCPWNFNTRFLIFAYFSSDPRHHVGWWTVQVRPHFGTIIAIVRHWISCVINSFREYFDQITALFFLNSDVVHTRINGIVAINESILCVIKTIVDIGPLDSLGGEWICRNNEIVKCSFLQKQNWIQIESDPWYLILWSCCQLDSFYGELIR